MHKVEVFYVLCLFLTGKHKLIVSWNFRYNKSFKVDRQLTEFHSKNWAQRYLYDLKIEVDSLHTVWYREYSFIAGILISLSLFYLIIIYLFSIFATGSEEAVRNETDSWNEPVIWQNVMAERNRKNVSICTMLLTL